MRESLKNKKERAAEAVRLLKEAYPDSDCTLDYKDPLQLLIATQLAAQCTDARVNLVTPALFAKYPDVYAFAAANELELREMIHSTGFFKNKAKNIIGCCQKLISDFDGIVPDTMEELITLPGVGRKTANLIVGDVYGKPSVVVDTHCIRITTRIGLHKETDPKKIEFALKKILPPEESGDFCHRIVLHGRDLCTARSPKCSECPLNTFCKYGLKNK